jgi:alkaline phosphatase D
MNMLRIPSVGPIVGHVTDNSARIWIRGFAEDKDMRTIGVAALFLNGTYVSNSVRYFRMQREYDRTGTTDFKKLKPDTVYIVRVASLALDSTDPTLPIEDNELEAHLPEPKVWVDDLKAMSAESCSKSASFLGLFGPDQERRARPASDG